jgi:predicted transcriptional regulator
MIGGDVWMLAIRLPPDIEERLEALARRTGRSKSFYLAEEALAEHHRSGRRSTTVPEGSTVSRISKPHRVEP